MSTLLKSLILSLILFHFVTTTVAAEGVPVEPITPDQSFQQLRDPFRRPAQVMVNGIKKTILESYEVSEFKMVGVLTGPHQTRAMILDPTGASHFVGLNAKIGTHDGKVIQIFGDRIRVREKIENYSGKAENIDTDILIQLEGKLAQ